MIYDRWEAMLTGGLPFNGEIKKEIITKIIDVQYDALPMGFSPTWYTLIIHMLQPDP